MHAPVPKSPPALLEPSFADAIEAIDQAASLERSQKQHWSCSLRQIAKALGRPMETIPARWTSVRMSISALHHVMAGNREKTLQNHKANVRRALVWFAGEHEVSPRGVRLRSEWLALRVMISERRDRLLLSGLMRFCSGKVIVRDQVNETALDAYMAYRAATTRLAANDAARREIARAWNRCVASVPGWPSQLLNEPPL